MRWPWISREHHEEVIAAKDALIASLQAQNAILGKRLAEPVTVSVQMPENFTLLQPAIVKHRKEPAAGTEPRKEAPEVDWANVDPDNPFVMAQLAAQEYGRQLAPIELAEWVARVRRQIRAAKDQGIRTPQIPQVGTLETKPVPPHITEMIERAEAV